MKATQLVVPPRTRASAERYLLRRAYKVYQFPADDDRTNDDNPGLKPVDVSTPLFKPGTKVCLVYNKQVEMYVVLSVAHGPCSYGKNTLDSRGNTNEFLALSNPCEPYGTPATAKDDPATNEDRSKNTADTGEGRDAGETCDAADTQANEPAPSTRLPFIYLLYPIATNATKLTSTSNLSSAKLISEHHLVLPPAYLEGRVIHIPILHRGVEVHLPVEIKKVERGLGLSEPTTYRDVIRQMIRMNISTADVIAGPLPKCKGAEEDVWKYEFVHGSVWLSEDAVLEMVQGHVGGIWDTITE